MASGKEKRSRSTRPKLTFEQANAVCREFLPIGGGIFDYADELQKAGFSAFIPHYEFLESFCGSREENEIRRWCLIEGAKNRLGRPWPLRVSAAEEELLYASPFIQQLCQERDEANGVPVTQLSNQYPGQIWRLEIDPCEQRRAYALVHEKQIYRERWNAVLQERKRRLELEVVQHSTGLAASYAFDKRGRFDFFAAVMERHATPLGFRYDDQKSYPHYPVFVKQISQFWSLCWAIEETNTFFWSGNEGQFAPCLEIRNSELRGSVNKADAGEFLFVRYQHIIPGFGSTYWKFFDLDQLETMIKAHLCFYSLMAPIIEGGLNKILGTDVSGSAR
jgi:hypothetical protein